MSVAYRSSAAGLVVGLAVAALAVVAPEAAAAPRDLTQEQERIKIGREIAPVPLRLGNRANRNWVFLGSYLVNAVGGCNDCHTNPPFAAGGDPYQGEPKQINADGYLAGGVEFGPFTSRNITPDEHGLPAGYTYAEFREVIRTGIDLKHLHPQFGPLLQVMPWPVFQNMSDRDLFAIYSYLSAIPSIASH